LPWRSDPGPRSPLQHAWVGATQQRLYVNFLSDEGAAGVEAAYGKRLARLVALKDRYDSTNFFFRLNANIAPSQQGNGR
jgi:hypothetical protein